MPLNTTQYTLLQQRISMYVCVNNKAMFTCIRTDWASSYSVNTDIFEPLDHIITVVSLRKSIKRLVPHCMLNVRLGPKYANLYATILVIKISQESHDLLHHMSSPISM